METGRKTDVLFADCNVEKGVVRDSTVWADSGLSDVIESVEGVERVFTPLSPIQYHIYLDPRYDYDIVKQNIETAILRK